MSIFLIPRIKMNAAAACTICASAIFAGSITFCIASMEQPAPFTFSDTLLTGPNNVLFWSALGVAYPLVVVSRARTLKGAFLLSLLYTLLIFISLYKYIDNPAHATFAVLFVFLLCAVYTYDVVLLCRRNAAWTQLCGAFLVLTITTNLCQFIIYTAASTSYAYMVTSLLGYYLLVVQYMANTLLLQANKIYYLAHSGSTI